MFINRRILLVDSDFAEANLLYHYLSKHNCTVLKTVVDFKDTVISIHQLIPDIVIISINSLKEKIIMSKIASHIHLHYGIQVIILKEFDEQENLDNIIDPSCRL